MMTRRPSTARGALPLVRVTSEVGGALSAPIHPQGEAVEGSFGVFDTALTAVDFPHHAVMKLLHCFVFFAS